MKNTYTLIILALICSVSLISCDHKDILYDDTETPEVRIVFDWRNAPDAHPQSVVAYLFPESGSNTPFRYNFSGFEGGKANVPGGNYIGLGMNSDNSDWARFRNTDNHDQFEIYTDDLSALTTYGLETRSLPRMAGTENERMASAASDRVWSHRQDAISVDPYTLNQIITFYPEEITCHYTVTVNDIENMDYLNGADLDATLSGLSESYFIGQKTTSTNPVTMPVCLHPVNNKNSVSGSFINFGDTSDAGHKHILTIYLVFDDHTGSYATYDVTDQVRNAPDPHHVDIIVNGLVLPRPIATGNGFVPNVNDWNSVDYTLEM